MVRFSCYFLWKPTRFVEWTIYYWNSNWTVLCYRICYFKQCTTSNWKEFWIRSSKRSDLIILIRVGFPERDRLTNQLRKNDSCYRPPVHLVQCNIKTKRRSDAGIKITSAHDKYSLGFSQILSCFQHLTKDDILQNI